jgi:uncharacterized membrane protein
MAASLPGSSFISQLFSSEDTMTTRDFGALLFAVALLTIITVGLISVDWSNTFVAVLYSVSLAVLLIGFGIVGIYDSNN